MKLIIIIILLLINYSYCYNIKLLKNGGVQLDDKIICPLSYGNSDCSYIINTTEICNKAYDSNYGQIGNICCWSKYRKQINLTEYKETRGINENRSENDKIIGIFEAYGPYFERDISFVNSIIEKDSNNQYKMKYSQFLNKNPNNNQIQIDGGQALGFVILIHKIDMDAIRNIFKVLYQPYHYYVIHIDNNYLDSNQIETLNKYLLEVQLNGKSSSTKYEKYPNNIRISDKRFHGEWGTVSLVYMELASYTVLFEMVNERSEATNSPSLFSHMINLSANDMPTKSLKYISKTLFEGENINTSYIHCCIADVTHRYEKIYYENNRGKGIAKDVLDLYECGLEKVPSNKDILDGSQWHFLTSKFIHYLITSPSSLEKLFSLRFTLIPDESYFQNMNYLYNEIYQQPVSRNTHRLTIWKNYKYEITIDDFDYITKEDSYFVRKVYNNTVREEIIKKFDLIEQ